MAFWARSESDARPGGERLGARIVRVPLEVVAEHAGELARLAVVRVRVGPGRARVEQVRVDGRHLDRHLEAEERVGPVLDRLQRARQSGVEERARRLDRHPLALAELAASPARVHEPDAGAVLDELLAEHPRVYDRRLREERRAEARGEGRLRVADADLRAGNLGRVAG